MGTCDVQQVSKGACDVQQVAKGVCDVQQVAKGVCDVGERNSVGGNATTQVVVTVEKCSRENKMI